MNDGGGQIINSSGLGDVGMDNKKLERIEMHKSLQDEIARMWVLMKETVIPILVGALRILIPKFEKFVGKTLY